jgi:LemA protein
LWLIETEVFQIPQLHKHLNVVRNLFIHALMKRILIFIVVFSCSLFTAAGQNKNIEDAFSSLKSTLVKRSKAASNLVEYAGKFSLVDTTLFQSAKHQAEELKKLVSNAHKPNSDYIKAIYKKDSGLKQTLGRALVTLEAYPNLRKEEGYMHLMLQLLDLEKMLKTAGKNYNEQCLKYGHEELLFGKEK